MIDVSKIEIEYLEILSAMYMHAMLYYNVEPVDASVKKQKKIRKWISRQYTSEIYDLPEYIWSIFSKDNCDIDVLNFLNECLKQVKLRQELKIKKFQEECCNLAEDVKYALAKLMELEFWQDIKQNDNTLYIVVENVPAFRSVLKLQNVEGVPQEKEGYNIKYGSISFDHNRNRYCFSGKLEEPIEDTLESFEVTFEDAEVDIRLFNACEGLLFWDNPWDWLRSMCFSIGMKVNIPEEYCNPLELELMPLFKEIVALEYWMELPKQNCFDFTVLKGMAERYKYKEIVELLVKLESVKPGAVNYHRNVKKLISQLCKQKYEPMWREIYEKIKDSQKDYANKVEVTCSPEILSDTREKIQLLMESKGYMGEGWGMFFWIFFVGGGLFSIMMSLMSLVMCTIVTIVLGLYKDIPEMIMSMPWGLLLAIGWIGFGAAMGVTEVMVRRK